MSHPVELYIGLMSGTSVDGVDAALVGFESSSKLKVIATEFTPFPDDLRNQISSTALNNTQLYKNDDSPLHEILAKHYANASLNLLQKAGVDKKNIRAIANHGQTVRHEPNGNPAFSLQLGNGRSIAELTGIQVISQFRQADIKAGGQGAPLMPAFHNEVFKQSDNTLILNLGGIANISQLGENVLGFDTGPGNCLLDQWIDKHHKVRFDENGEWAASGKTNGALLSRLLKDPYFVSSQPKSTGTDYFNLDWLLGLIPELERYAPQDIQSTLLALTTESVALAIASINAHSGSVYVCGGGARNMEIMTQLQQRLPNLNIAKTDALGVPSDWVEAVGFAWLGYCYSHSICSNLPSVTGATKSLILGESFLPVVVA